MLAECIENLRRRGITDDRLAVPVDIDTERSSLDTELLLHGPERATRAEHVRDAGSNVVGDPLGDSVDGAGVGLFPSLSAVGNRDRRQRAQLRGDLPLAVLVLVDVVDLRALGPVVVEDDVGRRRRPHREHRRVHLHAGRHAQHGRGAAGVLQGLGHVDGRPVTADEQYQLDPMVEEGSDGRAGIRRRRLLAGRRADDRRLETHLASRPLTHRPAVGVELTVADRAEFGQCLAGPVRRARLRAEFPRPVDLAVGPLETDPPAHPRDRVDDETESHHLS